MSKMCGSKKKTILSNILIIVFFVSFATASAQTIDVNPTKHIISEKTMERIPEHDVIYVVMLLLVIGFLVANNRMNHSVVKSIIAEHKEGMVKAVENSENRFKAVADDCHAKQQDTADAIRTLAASHERTNATMISILTKEFQSIEGKYNGH